MQDDYEFSFKNLDTLVGGYCRLLYIAYIQGDQLKCLSSLF